MIAFINLILLTHARNKVSVKENLELDSIEIKLVERILVNQPNEESTLVLLENLFLMMTCLPLTD